MNESLSLTIRHHTGFTYDGLAKSSYNEARMTPITGASQEVRHAHVTVAPVVPLSTHTDYFGTIVTAFDIQEPHPKLEVEATSTVESRAGLIAPAISWSDLRAPALVDFFSEYLFETDRTKLAGEVLAPLEEWTRSRTCTVVSTRSVPTCASTSPIYRGPRRCLDRARGVGPGRRCLSGPHAHHHRTAAPTRIPARYISGYLFPLSDADVGEDRRGAEPRVDRVLLRGLDRHGPDQWDSRDRAPHHRRERS